MKSEYNLLVLVHRYEKFEKQIDKVNPFHIRVQLVLEEISGDKRKYTFIDESERHELFEKNMKTLLKYTGQNIGRDISILARGAENESEAAIKRGLLSKIGKEDFNYEINQIKIFNGKGLRNEMPENEGYKKLTKKEYEGLMQGFAEWGYERTKKESLIKKMLKR